MSFVTAATIRSLEERAFFAGTTEEDLMERAGAGIARRLADHFPTPGEAVGYLGKGHNAGDALVALRHLRSAGWKVSWRGAYPPGQWAELTRRKLGALGQEDSEAETPGRFSRGPLLLLDGLLGIGARGALRPELATLAAEMEDLRRCKGAYVAAMDLPSGTDPDNGHAAEGAVTADLTLAVGMPKLGMLTDEGIRRAGRLFVVPLQELAPANAPGPRIFCPEWFPGLMPPRPHDAHKGTAGRVGLIAGSPGMNGAAVLAATGALRAGAGLVTLHVSPEFLQTMAVPMPAEVMVRISENPVTAAFAAGHDALVIGPGCGAMGAETRRELMEALEHSDIPAVIDADGLNAVAVADSPGILAERHLITPHPGEFRRLCPDLAGLPRLEAVASFTDRYKCALLLKGARTLVGAAGLDVRVNPTGHAGMASGGQGDVLSGVAGALLAGGHTPADAGALAAWWCGRAAERAMANSPFTTAGDTLAHLGEAMHDWRECRR